MRENIENIFETAPKRYVFSLEWVYHAEVDTSYLLVGYEVSR